MSVKLSRDNTKVGPASRRFDALSALSTGLRTPSRPCFHVDSSVNPCIFLPCEFCSFLTCGFFSLLLCEHFVFSALWFLLQDSRVSKRMRLDDKPLLRPAKPAAAQVGLFMTHLVPLESAVARP